MRGAWFRSSANDNYLGTFTFASLDEASAFLAEAASSFAFLGCEIQRV